MAATNYLSPIFLTLLPLVLAQGPSAPAPSSAGPVNLTAILQKNGQYTTLIRLLNETGIDDQITNQLNSSSDGLTVLAPTDNAFSNLKAGTINGLTTQQQVQLILYHVLPKYYSFSDLQLVSNPARTQATGNNGVWGLNFTSQNNQVNVSSGVVQTQVYNPLRQQAPLAVYQLDQVLLPDELFGVKATTEAAPAPSGKTSSLGKSNSTVSSAEEPSPANGARERSAGLGFMVGLAAACLGALF